MFFRKSLGGFAGGDAAESLMFAALARSIGDAMIAKDLQGSVTAWNAGAERLYGFRPDEIVGQSIEKTYPDDQLDAERERHAKVVAGGFESGYRCTRIRADGTSVDVVMTLSPLRDEAGTVTGVASLSRPVNAAELDQSRLASIVEIAPDGILCVNRSGTIVMLNAQLCKLFGYEREEVLGAQLELLLPESFQEEHERLREHYFAKPVIRTMVSGLALLARKKDGSQFPVEVSLAPHTSGNEEMAIAVVRDVSEQRALESTLRESEMQLRQIAESANVVFILLQLNPLQVLYVSPDCVELFDIEPEALVRSNFGLSSVHPEDVDQFLHAFLDATLAGKPASSEHRIVVADNRIKWIRMFAYPIPSPQGRTERMAITAEDITEQEQASARIRAAELEARNANLAKNEFLSRMSHELRTPLNAILGFGQLLQRQLEGPQYSESVGHILKAGRHLLDLINDVLEIAKIEANEMSLSMEPVSIRDTMQEVLMMMDPIALSADVELQADIHDSTLWVRADRLRLRQILLNLISNAIKYNHVGGHVWVDGTESSGEILLTVRDDGPGIASELQSRLFTPFDRLGAEIGGVEGTGIGLSLTRALVELLGGTITVQSTPGLGSTFTVALPVDSGVTEANAQSLELEFSEKEDAVLAASATVLYVEDNLPNVRLVESLLELRPGWQLLHASLGQLGIDMARAHVPNLVILDLHLPDISGRDVLTALKGDPVTSWIPVLILTADVGASQRSLLSDHEQISS